MDKTKYGKFYLHNIKEAQNANNKRRHLARALSARYGIPAMIEYQILHLIEIAKNGLPDCYKFFEDFLFDFWPDFTWEAEKSKEEALAVFEDSRIKEIIPILNKTWNIDMEEILTATPTEEV